VAKLSFEMLRVCSEFQLLTVRQRKAVEIFLATGDKAKAVSASYHCKTPETVRVMCYRVFNHPRVIAVLAVANGADPDKVVFLERVERLIRSKKTTVAQVQAIRLYGQMLGFIDGQKPEPEPEFESNPKSTSTSKSKASQAQPQPQSQPPQDLDNLYGL